MTDLHARLAAAIRDCPARYPDDIATAVMAALKPELDRLHRAEAELQQIDEADSRDAAAGSYAERAETAEAAIARARAPHQPQPDGSGFPDSQQCRTCSTDGGDGYQYLVPWPCPTVIALEAAGGSSPAAWTPPPPGDRREPLPHEILTLLASLDPPSYLSTACQTAALCQDAYQRKTRWVGLLHHAERLHARCRLNHKFTGQLCACGCHSEQPAAAPDGTGLYDKIAGMFSGPLPPPGDVPPATVLPCNHAQLRQPHTPHRWQPQPGMRPVQCPGYARVPADTATPKEI